MDNVFDLIEAFYEQDYGWSDVLSRTDAEGYLRQRIMEGATDDELIEIWDNVNCFCIFASHVEAYLGDLNGDDIVDGIAWCARNISGFKATELRVVAFLNDITGLYQYLAKRKKVRSFAAPLEAMDLLATEEGITIMDEDGNFLPGYESYEELSSPDLPEKIFFNIGNLVDRTIDKVSGYFLREKQYKMDIARARYMFGNYLEMDESVPDDQKQEFEKSFWEYFVLDYHMLDQYKTPLELYYEYAQSGVVDVKNSPIFDMLKELLKAELVLFSMEEPLDEGTVSCRNFLTGESYAILMDSSNVAEYKGMLFLGHIFYNKSIALSTVRGHNIKNSSKKVLFDILEKAKSWISVRHGGQLSWSDFTKEFPVFMRHAIMIYSGYVRMDRFDFKTNVTEYLPQPVLEDDVSQKLKKVMGSYFFSSLDVRLAQTLWSDFQHVSGEKVILPDVWAAGVLQIFVELNAVYTYDLQKVSEICEFVPVDAIRRASESIKAALAIEKHDPRYVNEESLLMMAVL